MDTTKRILTHRFETLLVLAFGVALTFSVGVPIAVAVRKAFFPLISALNGGQP